MTDFELHRLCLNKFYENRKSRNDICINPEDFENQLDENEIQRIEISLYEQGFIEGIVISAANGWKIFFNGHITTKGISIIENQSLDGNVPQFNTINISDSNQFQIGNQNAMNISNEFDITYNQLLEKIEKLDEPEDKKSKAIELLKKGVSFLGKETAKGMIVNFLKNPNLDSIINTIQTLI